VVGVFHFIQLHLASTMQNVVNLCALIESFRSWMETMNADRFRRCSACGILILLLASPGCGKVESGAATGAEAQSAQSARHFDSAASGTIRGRVSWEGVLPKIPKLKTLPNPLGSAVFKETQIRPNPNAPIIDPHGRGVADVVVYLRGVPDGAGKPWHHPPVTVAQCNCEYQIEQSGAPSRFGFVRHGDRVKIVSRDRHLYTVHASGAEFFALSFPDPEQPLERTLAHDGVVELTSGVGYYWMRAYLFVAGHPYFTRTNQHGEFELTEVPAGQYELACWLPNWNEANHDRDPESRLISRLYFQPPVQKARLVTLDANQTVEANFTVRTEDFRRRSP
jgi:hypothetical protein